MSKPVINSISATNLANRVINQHLYNATKTKNAQPLSAFDFIHEPKTQKKHLNSLHTNNHGLSINAGGVTPQKNAQPLFSGVTTGTKIGEYEHNRFAVEVELMNGEQLRVITRHRAIMCFITTVLTLTIIGLTKYN